MTGGGPNEEDRRPMLNERKQKAKVEKTSKMQGDAEGEMRGGIGRNAGRKRQQGGGMELDNVAGK